MMKYHILRIFTFSQNRRKLTKYVWWKKYYQNMVEDEQIYNRSTIGFEVLSEI